MFKKVVILVVILTATNAYAAGTDKPTKVKEAPKEEPYVLVVATQRSKTITMQEFSSKERCEAVKDTIKAAEHDSPGEFDLSLVEPFRMRCFPK